MAPIPAVKVVYTPAHLQHQPPAEFVGDKMAPYSECPARIESIYRQLGQTELVEWVAPTNQPAGAITAVHDNTYLNFLERIFPAWTLVNTHQTSIIPETFAVRHLVTKPANLLRQPGYYCFDAQTPIVSGTWAAATAAAHNALCGADILGAGDRIAYALCRPPGHHAGRALYGGYSYLNNAAIAAARLQNAGRVAILDIDYHHGNGTQEIFYDSAKVLYVSLHADPNRAFPFFSGYPAEQGRSIGYGYNHNFPLPAATDDERYLDCLECAIEKIQNFQPANLVVSLGLDIFGGDPLGDFRLTNTAFAQIGQRLATLSLPTLLVQEGGYDTDRAGDLVVDLLRGWVDATV